MVRKNGRVTAIQMVFAVILAVTLVFVTGMGRVPGPKPFSKPLTFTVKSLLGGSQNDATAINDRGEITGNASTKSGPDEAFLYANGKLRLLGLPADSQNTYGMAINDHGVVAVSVEKKDQQGHRLAYLAQVVGRRVVWTRLPEPRGRYPYGSPTGINGIGTVAGQSPAIGSTHAAIWRASKGAYHINRAWVSLTHLSELGGIDKQGDIAGTDLGSSGQVQHALLWHGRKRPVDLGCSIHSAKPRQPSCRKWQTANAVALARHRRYILTVGARLPNAHSSRSRATEWVLDLGAKGVEPSVSETALSILSGYSHSIASSINSRGWIVGQMGNAVPGWHGYSSSRAHIRSLRPSTARTVPDPIAVLWVRKKAYDLNRLLLKGSGWELQDATGINSRGQIVGNGTFRGVARAFVLTPS